MRRPEVWERRRVSRAVVMDGTFEYSDPAHQDKAGRSPSGPRPLKKRVVFQSSYSRNSRVLQAVNLARPNILLPSRSQKVHPHITRNALPIPTPLIPLIHIPPHLLQHLQRAIRIP